MGRSPARRPHQPYGAFYIMVDVSRSGLDGRTFALRLVEEERVAVAPGAAFGDVARDQVRVSLATERGALLEGVDRLCRTVVRMVDINANTPVETRR